MTTYWDSRIIKFLRWIIFIPIGMILVSWLETLPPRVVIYAMSTKPEFNYLTLIIGIFVVSILGTIFFLWLFLICASVTLSCNVIAPNGKIASIIFGTVYCLLALPQLIDSRIQGLPWIITAYLCAVMIIVTSSTVLSYRAV